MAVEDAVVGYSSLIATGVLIIRPTVAGEEWTIHNIYVPFGKKFELYRCNDPSGVNNGILWGPVNQSLSGQYNFHCTTDEFMLLKNIDSTTEDVGYDGVVTNTS